MDTLVRLLTPDDEPLLWIALYHALYIPPGESAPPWDVVRAPELACYVAGWMQRPGDLGAAAEHDGKFIGAAWLRRWSAGEQGYGFVDVATPELSMAVLPGHRGCGTGTVLLERLLCSAAEEYETVSLSVAEANPARRLYERAGFQRVGEQVGESVTMMLRFGPKGVLR